MLRLVWNAVSMDCYLFTDHQRNLKIFIILSHGNLLTKTRTQLFKGNQLFTFDELTSFFQRHCYNKTIFTIFVPYQTRTFISHSLAPCRSITSIKENICSTWLLSFSHRQQSKWIRCYSSLKSRWCIVRHYQHCI